MRIGLKQRFFAKKTKLADAPRPGMTEDNVRFIFQLRAQGWTAQRLAAEFGVRVRNIYDILARKLWKHVELEAQF